MFFQLMIVGASAGINFS